jgi:hypothetical protein
LDGLSLSIMCSTIPPLEKLKPKNLISLIVVLACMLRGPQQREFFIGIMGTLWQNMGANAVKLFRRAASTCFEVELYQHSAAPLSLIQDYCVPVMTDCIPLIDASR